ncbi:hypothetical protein [Nodularia spumigena]|uniref:hypothetical protein n=1 Tax=Nodularia spumigena TaxID=70799 RepID=UPI0023306DEA|nr:hypothetical protein [Nodularia spumigena]MDB9347565.1 hypothetical protein [Nodularia spumigena CS-588/01]MDB9351748.1 hypothetical protein [Nodularia spumigena CS-588/05]
MGCWVRSRLGMLGCDRFLGMWEGDSASADLSVRFLGCWGAIVFGMLRCYHCLGLWGAIAFGMWECDRLKLGLCAIAKR